MNNTFDSIKQGLQEVVEYAQGNKSGVRVHYSTEPDVKAIRTRIGMNQNEFASTIGISLQTLRYWEKGQRKPKGPVLVLLNIIEKAPDTVMNILSH
ncbi:HTH domain-containing protein, Cro/C1-type [Desulfonema limicola]|uniref:HTH domain-containing protein, Cro/C1-type n=1 Tax=Desulfonema limicola TaxID=45656 RepID=A0A975B5V1_9BACT|nr:NadS family protein [Desulfonema limicola]QTA79373.1 HTH domain-containing protein, Cro/C1-type [Desulfonema limicola]